MRTLDRSLTPSAPVARQPRSVRIRAIRPTDATELERFYTELSPDSRRTRFFTVAPRLSHVQAVSFCTTDHDHREGFVAVLDRDQSVAERIVGHLCLEPYEDPAGGDIAGAAEVAIAVADEFQHRGIGRRLLAAGTEWARRERIGRLTATTLEGNAPIHRLLGGLAGRVRERPIEAGLSEITIDLVDRPPTAAPPQAAQQRGRPASQARW